MKDKFLDIDEELVDFAEASGFDFQSGSYLANGNLLKEEIPVVQKDIFNVLKSVFMKPKLAKN